MTTKSMTGLELTLGIERELDGALHPLTTTELVYRLGAASPGAMGDDGRARVLRELRVLEGKGIVRCIEQPPPREGWFRWELTEARRQQIGAGR